MTEEKICPFMSRPYLHVFDCNDYTNDVTLLHAVGCKNVGCMAWVPEQKVEWRCTLDITKSEMCKLDQLVEVPDNRIAFCDGCEYYKMFEIKPIPAHCKMIGGVNDKR